jgi:hypothetical protein
MGATHALATMVTLAMENRALTVMNVAVDRTLVTPMLRVRTRMVATPVLATMATPAMENRALKRTSEKQKLKTETPMLNVRTRMVATPAPVMLATPAPEIRVPQTFVYRQTLPILIIQAQTLSSVAQVTPS